MTSRTQRDRPARNPGGMVCDECSEVFIGADWHAYCGICVELVSAREAAARKDRYRRYSGTRAELRALGQGSHTTSEPPKK